MKKNLGAYELYGKRASNPNFQEIAGRFAFQKKAEQYLLLDLLKTLSLSPEDDLFEVGCGAGNLLIPLSFFVRSVTGIDHPKLLKKLRSRLPKDSRNMMLIPGNFLNTDVKTKFSKILIYGVAQCLKDEKEFAKFIRKSVSLLKPGGRILIGDIPNADKKKRFISTEQGKEFNAKWQKQVNTLGKGNPTMAAGDLLILNDEVIWRAISLLEKLGLRAKVLPQQETLAFSYTREDILAEKK